MMSNDICPKFIICGNTDIYGHLRKSTEIYGYLWYLSVSSGQRLHFLQSKTSTYDAIASLD